MKWQTCDPDWLESPFDAWAELLLTLRAAQVLQGLLDTHSTESEAAMQARIAVADFVHSPDLNSQACTAAAELNVSYFSRLRGEASPVNMQGEEATFWAIQCNDTGTSFDPESWMLESALNAELYPLFGSFNVVNPCLYWGGAKVRKLPIEKATRAGGLVMLQSRLDPLTLLEGTLKSFAAMPNASMILIENEYQHAIGIPYGNDCIDRPIAEYLLHGTQPPRMTSCKGKPLRADVPPP